MFARSGQFAGCEVLARCPAPDGGLLSATVFGDLLEVEDWALVDRSMAHAAARLSRHRRRWRASAWVSWNTAPSTLSDAYADELEAIVARAGGDRSHLHLELTEQRPVPGVSDRRSTDSSGPGSASPSTMWGGSTSPSTRRQVPFRLAKLERELIAKPPSPNPASPSSATTSACHAHGARVVAEGVETAAELEAVLDAGCDDPGVLVGLGSLGGHLGPRVRHGPPSGARRYPPDA
ncbi:MAG: EAL domain-containing protein [Ilumatobacteraceae bacterium]